AAKAAFDAPLAIDPQDPRARFYLALAESQAGHLDAALGAWVALESESPADAPWREMVAGESGATPKKRGPAAPTPPRPQAAAPRPGRGERGRAQRRGHG